MMAVTLQPPRREINSALFIDFDNIYLTLQAQDEQLAHEFANNPARWVNWLEKSITTAHLGHNVRRRLLIRRCYLNPASFWSFRNNFTRAAIQVVDCPSLTGRGNNAGDIIMVLDIVDTMQAATYIDEFIILSCDSDFTPVLYRLRANARYTAILSVGPSSNAYRMAADTVIDSEDFYEYAISSPEEPEHGLNGENFQISGHSDEMSQLLTRMADRLHEEAAIPGGIVANELPALYKEFAEFRESEGWLGFGSLRRLTFAIIEQRDDLVVTLGEDPWRVVRTEYAEQTTAQTPGYFATPIMTPLPVESRMNSSVDPEQVKRSIAVFVLDLVRNSSGPVPLAAVAGQVKANFVDALTDGWMGTEKFKDFLHTLDLGQLIITDGVPGYLVDNERYQGEEFSSSASLPFDRNDTFAVETPEMAALAKRITAVSNIPYLSTDHYAKLFEQIARAIREEGYNLTKTSKLVRDRCQERGLPVNRQKVNQTLYGIYYGGHRLDEPGSDEVEVLRNAFYQHVLDSCEREQIILSGDEEELLRRWLSVSLPVEVG